jgi:hypothetical protein
MIVLEGEVRDQVKTWRDKVHAKLSSFSPVIDKDKEDSWDRRPCSRYDKHDLKDNGYSNSIDDSDLKEYFKIREEVTKGFPGTYVLDSKCAILFTEEEAKIGIKKLHDHGTS